MRATHTPRSERHAVMHLLGFWRRNVVEEVPGASARAMGTGEGARGLGARGHT